MVAELEFGVPGEAPSRTLRRSSEGTKRRLLALAACFWVDTEGNLCDDETVSRDSASPIGKLGSSPPNRSSPAETSTRLFLSGVEHVGRLVGGKVHGKDRSQHLLQVGCCWSHLTLFPEHCKQALRLEAGGKFSKQRLVCLDNDDSIGSKLKSVIDFFNYE
jgi:hypothetical protein